MAEIQNKLPYAVYDKDGNFMYFRMTKRIKNELGQFDVLTARSKKSEKDCRKKLDGLVQDYYVTKEKNKHKAPSSDMPFKEFAENWYELNIANSSVSKTTKGDYRNYVFTHIVPFFKDYRLCEIHEDDCQRFLNKYVGYSKDHVSKLRMCLRRMLRKARKQKLIPDNPAEDIVLPDVYKNKRRPITNKEREMLLEAAKTHYAGTMFLTMLYCGLRPIEIRNLKWEDIDFKEDTIRVTASKTEAGEDRLIPIPHQLRSSLLQHKLKGQNEEWVFVRCKNHNLPMDENAFYHAWHNICRQMDINNGAKVYRNQIVESTLAEDFQPYLLRHTFCTDCQAAGVPLNVAKDFMGHADISVTAKIYTHMVDEVFEQNRKRLAEYADEKDTQTA